MQSALGIHSIVSMDKQVRRLKNTDLLDKYGIKEIFLYQDGGKIFDTCHADSWLENN